MFNLSVKLRRLYEFATKCFGYKCICTLQDNILIMYLHFQITIPLVKIIIFHFSGEYKNVLEFVTNKVLIENL